MLLRRRRKWKSRGDGKVSRKRKWLIFLIVFVLLIVQGFIFIDRNLKTPMMHLAKIRLKQIATQSINAAITETISDNVNADKLIDWKLSRDGKVNGFNLNYSEHIRITADMIRTVETLLKKLGTVPDHIPLFQGSAVAASFGPKVPIRFVPLGAAKVEVNTRAKDVAINMLLIEVYVRIVAEVTVVIPFDSESELVETEIPISYSLVVGDVPAYYFDNKGNPIGSDKDIVPPTISLPPNLNLEQSETTSGEPAGEEISPSPSDQP